jgi:hypothetical protein
MLSCTLLSLHCFVYIALCIRDLLWDGHLARPNLGGQDAHPTRLSDKLFIALFSLAAVPLLADSQVTSSHSRAFSLGAAMPTSACLEFEL